MAASKVSFGKRILLISKSIIKFFVLILIRMMRLEFFLPKMLKLKIG
ncbi:MAG: hypothetical protein K6T54_12145 [Ignavibacterium sp.]|nr:hypothetical protein [Ignavibacterium sp.]